MQKEIVSVEFRKPIVCTHFWIQTKKVETLLKYYLRLSHEECLVLLSPVFCPLSLNLSANLLWRITICGLFDFTWDVVTHWSQLETESEKEWHIYEEERMALGKLSLGRKTTLTL